jgi:DNA recombination protein RmuC
VGELRERLVRIDAAQKQLGDLSSQVVGLRDILSNKQARGAFGEVMLEDLVRQVLPPAAYEFQAALGDGRRADCLLKLPNPPGPIAVDAKFPLEAWRALAEAADEAARTLAARAFAVAIGKHIKDIQEKYIVPGETAESALMFLPSEAVYAELHANHPGLVEQSFRAKVFIVSPTTLWATLNTVRAVLRDVEMRQQAGRIQVEVQRLVDDIGRLDERVENLQRHFAQAEKDVREIATSSGKVKSRAERIGEVELDEGQSAEIADLAAARGALGSPKRT